MKTLNRKVALVLPVAAVLWVFATASGNASPFDKMTILKFSGAVALPGVTLGAGEYVFALANPATTGNVVVVTNKERTRVHALKITRPVIRPASAGRRAAVTLGEARPGTPPPIKAWYPEGDTIGHEFIY